MKPKLDHIGLVVKSMSDSAWMFRQIGFREITNPEPDSIQKVSACFVKVGNAEGIYIELLEPTEEGSPITHFLRKGGGLHHLCFEIEDIETTSNALREKGYQMICSPVECIGYDRSFQRKCTETTKIAFFLLPNKTLIELVQKGV